MFRGVHRRPRHSTESERIPALSTHRGVSQRVGCRETSVQAWEAHYLTATFLRMSATRAGLSTVML